MTKEIMWSNCRSCKQETKHQVLGGKSVTTPSEIYHDETKHYLLECCGCDTISFRKEYHDYEQYYQVGPDDYEHPIEIEVFPHYIKGHNPLESLSLLELPTVVSSIYNESLLAIQEGASTLASLGLRATIEAICNDKNITGKNLELRINSMHKSGLISKSDTDRLHAIRFMGNDAAHEIKKAKKQSVLIALKIIEHILLSVYIFEEEVNQHLEKPISTVEAAIPILESKLKNIENNSTFTLIKWLGNARRRVLENFAEIENELRTKIINNEILGVEAIDSPNPEEKNTFWYKKVALTPAEEDLF